MYYYFISFSKVVNLSIDERSMAAIALHEAEEMTRETSKKKIKIVKKKKRMENWNNKKRSKEEIEFQKDLICK